MMCASPVVEASLTPLTKVHRSLPEWPGDLFRAAQRMPGPQPLAESAGDSRTMSRRAPSREFRQGTLLGRRRSSAVEHLVFSSSQHRPELAVDRIDFRRCARFRVWPGIDRYDFTMSFHTRTGPDEVTPDPAESVDRCLSRHDRTSLCARIARRSGCGAGFGWHRGPDGPFSPGGRMIPAGADQVNPFLPHRQSSGIRTNLQRFPQKTQKCGSIRPARTPEQDRLYGRFP